jgi:CARDB
MKRFLVACLIALWAAPAALASSTSSGAQLQSFVCQRAVDPAARAIEVTAVMRPVPGTAHLALRVVLLHRVPGQGQFTPVSGHDLGKWISPTDPTLGQRPGDIWRLVKQVVDLPAGTYRFRVAFRWIGASGQTLATTARRTALCNQPELRADLRVTKIAILALPAVPGQDLYTATIRNGGRTAAPAFDVQLSVAGTIVANKTAGPLEPSSGTQISFQAPTCTAGDTVLVVADPEHRIDDADPTNNALSVPCPAAAPTPAGSTRPGR